MEYVFPVLCVPMLTYAEQYQPEKITVHLQVLVENDLRKHLPFLQFLDIPEHKVIFSYAIQLYRGISGPPGKSQTLW